MESIENFESRIPFNNTREVVGEDGNPTFELLHVPEGGGVLPLDRIAYSISGNTLALPPEILAEKTSLIEQRKTVNAKRYQAALSEWEEGGGHGEPPPQPSFFDGPLVRVLPSETFMTLDPKGSEVLVIPLGRTSYFDYVVTRRLDPSRYTEANMALPLAMCGVLTASDAEGRQQMIYTVRTTKVEQYSGFFHVVGGMLARPQYDMANPTGGWIKELQEEVGIGEEEVSLVGSMGLVMDKYYLHPEMTHRAKLVVSLEEVFDRNGIELKPKRETDREVELRCIPWEPEAIRALVTWREIPDGDQDLRPWVPTGLANILLAGRLEFGQAWFDRVVREYKERISLLNSKNRG